MEVPDIEAYVHPGEVLLTTLYPLRDDLAGVADLVRRLHAAALSALVVRLGRYVDHIPAPAVKAADELGFPIIVVDTHIAFNDVISAVLAIVLAEYGPEPAGPRRSVSGSRPSPSPVAAWPRSPAPSPGRWTATSPWSTPAAPRSAPAGRRPK